MARGDSHDAADDALECLVEIDAFDPPGVVGALPPQPPLPGPAIGRPEFEDAGDDRLAGRRLRRDLRRLRRIDVPGSELAGAREADALGIVLRLAPKGVALHGSCRLVAGEEKGRA